MNDIQWIGKTDTPRLSWGVNGENYTAIFEAAKDTVNPEERSILFRKAVTVCGELRSATLSICGLGFYQLHINGEQVGDNALAPLETAYRKWVLYDEYDVTALLRAGTNVLGVELGNARYSPLKKYWDWRAAWYGDPCLALHMRLCYTDGREEVLETDGSWKCAYGPILKNCFYDGEVYDARLELPGWNTAAFDDGDWQQALPVAAPGGKLEKNTYFHIKKHRTLQPEHIFQKTSTRAVYVFGENISGWVKIQVKGTPGAKVQIRYAEKVCDEELDPKSNGGATNTDIYILKDAPLQTYEPKFTFRGFSAVEISVEDQPAEILALEAYQIYADMPQSGHFACDHPDLERLHDSILRTQKAALLSYPVDCPQRDERMGWLGDAHVTAATCLYNFDMRRFYAKWLEDVRLTAHSESGAICFIAPSHWSGHAVDWSAGYAIVLWEQYLFYRDKTILEQHCPALIKYAEYLGGLGPILGKTRYGDWVSTAEGWVRGDPACCSSLYYYYTLLILDNVLRVLGRDEERARFAAIAQAEKEAILERFYDPQTKSFDSDTQFCLSFALKLKLIPQEDVPQVLEKLIKDIRDHGYHLTTGILGTRYVMEVLRDHDQQETAMKLILQKDYPSWLDIIRERTTLSERWDGRGSQNHCAIGSVGGIFYSMLAGIQVDEQIVIDPYPAMELNRVQAKVCLGDGTIEVSWKRQEEKINLSVDIAGSRQALFRGQTLTAGHYNFTL